MQKQFIGKPLLINCLFIAINLWRELWSIKIYLGVSFIQALSLEIYLQKLFQNVHQTATLQNLKQIFCCFLQIIQSFQTLLMQ